MSVSRITEIAEQQQETLTGYMGVIGSDHAYIHKGLAFTAIVNTGSISAAYDIAFTTPTVESGKEVHWRPALVTSTANAITYNLYEGDSFSAGTAVTPFNRNRTKADLTSDMQTFVQGATATPTGTVIDTGSLGTAGSGFFGQDTGGSANPEEHELVLIPNEDYVFTIVPSGATTVILKFFWYEE